MGRKRVDETGRFAAEGVAATEREVETKAAGLREATARARHKAPRPSFCKVYARARLAEALPELTEALLRESHKGSLPHLKAMVQLAGLDKGEVVPRKTRGRGKSLAAVLLEGFAAERAALAEREQGQADERLSGRPDELLDGLPDGLVDEVAAEDEAV